MREDIINTFPEATGFDRREFLVRSIFAAGTFAAAVMPIAAQTRIVTDSKGLIEGEVKIPVKDGEVPAYTSSGMANGRSRWKYSATWAPPSPW